ncbi:DUF4760 domain-containing protein [Cognaticolwellia mytili]|uniref:DUF4760 domain-containing protein n=1 Tax=Cognaticolwellia mytili TaxID=1888913 RepID=UPI000A16D5BB|nr:DUF4760 domain-containing protein [Cognaticolwellia mytili]
MEFITEYRGVAEFIYFLSGPLMLGGLVIAIFQLRQLKNDSNVKISRESMINSLSILERKRGEITKSHMKAFSNEGYATIPKFDGDEKALCRESSKCSKEWEDSFRNSTIFFYLVVESLNHLEVLSQYILSGVLDEEKCYELEGSSLLNYLTDFQPYFSVLRPNSESKVYTNLVTLYKLWKEKSEHDLLTSEHSKIQSKLSVSQRPHALKIIGK